MDIYWWSAGLDANWEEYGGKLLGIRGGTLYGFEHHGLRDGQEDPKDADITGGYVANLTNLTESEVLSCLESGGIEIRDGALWMEEHVPPDAVLRVVCEAYANVWGYGSGERSYKSFQRTVADAECCDPRRFPDVQNLPAFLVAWIEAARREDAKVHAILTGCELRSTT